MGRLFLYKDRAFVMNRKSLVSILILSIFISSFANAGEFPELDRTDTNSGIDNDKNGIRDDIDAYILKQYPNEQQRRAVKQLAKGLQAYLVADSTDSIVVKKVAHENARSMACVFSKFEDGIGPNGDISDEVFAITTNTKKRLLAYYVFDKALFGTVTSSPNKDFCDSWNRNWLSKNE